MRRFGRAVLATILQSRSIFLGGNGTRDYGETYRGHRTDTFRSSGYVRHVLSCESCGKFNFSLKNDVSADFEMFFKVKIFD